MARKVFISVLGTGFYGKCKYKKNDFVSTETRFIQKATLEYIKVSEWNSADAALFLLTPKAKEENWNKTIIERKHFTANENIPYKGLEKVLEEMQLPFLPTALDIPDGKNEEEMWIIFDTLLDALKDDDEIYFDLTHSFRYLPMLVLVFSNYAKFLKNAKIKHISYGNYEARNIETNEAPIIDLLPVSGLQDLTMAANDFIQFGKMGSFAQIIDGGNKGSVGQAIQRIKKEFTKLDIYIATCRMHELRKGDYIANINSEFDIVFNSDILQAAEKKLLSKIKTALNVFRPHETDENIDAAINWAFKYGMYQQAYTMGQELIITKVCNKLSYINPFSDIVNFRQFVSALLAISDKDVKNNKIEGILIQHEELTMQILNFDFIKEIRPIYAQLASHRNMINHGKKSDIDFKIMFEKNYYSIINHLNNSLC